MWTNADPVHWRIYAALGGDELTGEKHFLWWMYEIPSKMNFWTSFPAQISHNLIWLCHVICYGRGNPNSHNNTFFQEIWMTSIGNYFKWLIDGIDEYLPKTLLLLSSSLGYKFLSVGVKVVNNTWSSDNGGWWCGVGWPKSKLWKHIMCQVLFEDLVTTCAWWCQVMEALYTLFTPSE